MSLNVPSYSTAISPSDVIYFRRRLITSFLSLSSSIASLPAVDYTICYVLKGLDFKVSCPSLSVDHMRAEELL